MGFYTCRAGDQQPPCGDDLSRWADDGERVVKDRVWLRRRRAQTWRESVDLKARSDDAELSIDHEFSFIIDSGQSIEQCGVGAAGRCGPRCGAERGELSELAKDSPLESSAQ